MANRRQFLKTAAAGASAFLAAPYIYPDQSGKIYKTALIGTGWWGMNILGEAMKAGRSNVVALCDVDRNQLTPAIDKVHQLTGHKPKAYEDFRDLLAREKPEIVIVGTPDHWHPLITIAAVEAGAHVYVEKPIGHTIREGRAMVAAARANNRTVTVGTHRRVSPHNVSGMEFLRQGHAGKIGMVRAFVHYGGGPESPTPNEPAPDGLNWELWCGPAPLRPFNRKIHTRGFRQFLDYANGTLGDWGIHWMDQILWWAGDDVFPKRIHSTGGRPIAGPIVHDGISQTTDAPDHQVATFEFESFTATWEHRKFAGNNTDKGENVGCYFYGTKGIFHMGWRQGWTFYLHNAKADSIHTEPDLHEPDSQNIREVWADFLKCIESGHRPVCDIEIIHRSTNLSLLGMLSLKLGRSIEWDGLHERVPNDPEANALLYRDYRGEWKYPGT